MSSTLFEQILDYLSKIEILDRNSTCYIPLFNWGEPFSNTEINEILQALRKRRLHAQISSNLTLKPNIYKECLPVISDLTFSLSGFSQDSYSRIHGVSLRRTLDNFDSLYTDIRKYSPRTNIRISWHRYLFNENELWSAYRHFDRPLISFNPTVAYFSDILEMMVFLREELPEDRKKQAEKDLFLKHIHQGVARSRRKLKHYRCPAWDSLIIDETGQLLLCCGVTRYDSDHVLGNILEMSGKEIWKAKSSDPLCIECVSSGLALWVHNQNPYNSKAWPTGGGLNRPEAWLRYNFRPKLGRMLRRFPNGESILATIKRTSCVIRDG